MRASIDRGTPGLKLPLVSVVVTCYNHSDFLRACLDSVAGQTYPHLQVIVVDNVSTDNSRDVMAAFGADLPRADLAYETVYSAVNGHETGAMVQGFARTKGSATSASSTATICCCRAASRRTSRRIWSAASQSA